jgi:P-type Ca2+ transporter type 2C
VNFVALVVAFVAAVGSGETPLNVLQLLWVNLIMDSLGALGAFPRCVRRLVWH